MAAREAVPYDHRLSKTLALLARPGLLLATTRRSGGSNVMVIGWGTVGIVWGRPIFQVLVRPSRHTYGLLEESDEFTVNVPTDAMREWVAVCGTRSGRDIDKIAQCGLTARRAAHVLAPDIAQCPIVYECQVVHANDIMPARLAGEILDGAYMGADYHRVYFGKILSVRIDEDAASKLA